MTFDIGQVDPVEERIWSEGGHLRQVEQGQILVDS
jgi:hypothetical protein